ncbi:hypothetical protein B0H19DRAFT_957834, partial [Mycena capillaripes]
MTQTAQLQERLRSNSCPSDSEVSHCQTIISSSSVELERYDAEILRLKDALRQIELSRKAVEDYSLLCTAIFAPIRQLPAELLVKIFTLCSPAWDSPDYDDATEETELRRVAKVHLLQLSLVCSRWHTLAMGTPTLW